ncbi:MAG: tyrosine protein kinase [Burkholderiales bacterium]
MSSRPRFIPLGERPGSVVAADETKAAGPERPLGRIMRDAKMITEQQIGEILAHQRSRGVCFGEAAVALKLVSREDVEWAVAQQFEYPVAPEGAPGSPELVVATKPFGREAEAFRELRTQLMMGILSQDMPPCALAIVSPDIGDGRTYVAANVAVAFSQLDGGGTLLLDANLRRPRQQTLFGVETGMPGLASVLAGRADPRVMQPMRHLPSLHVLPAGTPPPNPLELLQRSAFAHLLRDLLGRFAYVIVDTPAASQGADARVIAAACGASLVLTRKGRSGMGPTGNLLRALTKGPGQIAGVVMNDH